MCNFIMIMILLVTAYTGIAKKGRRHGNSHGYSKYLRQPRVRTARLASLLGSPLWSGWRGIFFPDHQTAPILPATPCWPPRHALLVVHVIRHRIAASLPPAAGDRQRDNRIV